MSIINLDTVYAYDVNLDVTFKKLEMHPWVMQHQLFLIVEIAWLGAYKF